MTLPQQPSQNIPQSQHFLLKWNNHRSNMVSVFESLLQSENLVDVTLAVEGKFLKGHKIVLSACSPYFESMFVNQTPGEKHPILIFHDMKFSHLKTLLDFMYRGEISIDEKDLSDVLKVAEALSIRGLSSFESEDDEESEKEQNGNDNQAQGNNSNSGNNSNGGSNTCNTNNSCNSNSSSNSSSPSSSSSSTNNNGGFSAPGASGNTNNNNNSGGYGYNSSNSNNSASIISNENNNQVASSTQNQNDNHCLSSGNMNCDSSVNGSLNSKSQGGKSSASVRGPKKVGGFVSPLPPPPPVAIVKRRRGRQPIRKDTGSAPGRASAYKQPPIDKSTAPEGKSIPNRQRVRRRIPRQFPNAVSPSIKSRIKLEKHSETDEIGGVSGLATPDDDEMDTTDFLVPEMDGANAILPPDMCNSEPLSEMSVRGLDLFKYASIENGVYRCIECEKMCIPKTFKNKYSFQRHAFLYHEGNMRKVFPCPVCCREFSRPDKMKNHLRSIHEGKSARQNNGSALSEQLSTGGDSNDKCDG